MPTFTVEDQPDLTIPEDTIVRGRLSSIDVKTIDYADKKTGEPKSFNKLEWWWEVQDDRFPGRNLKGECGAQLSNHPNNKFRAWASALVGHELDVGEDINTDDLLGLVADLSVRHRPDSRDPKKVWEEVDEVIPVTGDDVPF